MNYFRGSGRCGLAFSPKNTNTTKDKNINAIESVALNKKTNRQLNTGVAQNCYPYGELYQPSN